MKTGTTMNFSIKDYVKFGRGALAVLVATTFATATIAETTLERIKRTGETTVGTEAAFPPFEFVEDGEIVGYGKDILDYIIADLDVELNQLDLPWQGILPGVLAGKFDFVATTVSVRPERVVAYAFTVPIAEGTTWTMIRKGDTSMTDVADLSGKVIGTQLSSASESAAREYEEALIAQGLPGFAELKLYTTYPEATLALANGELDVMVQSLPNLAVVVKEQPELFELLGAIDDLSYMGWVTRPEDTDLRDYLSSQIIEMRDNGKLYELQDKWFGFRMDIPDEGYLPEGAL
jgi:polar amino acid transport system substrate-binding protein